MHVAYPNFLSILFWFLNSHLLGRCYKVTSSKSLGQALESLAQKVQCGVVINFEKIGGASNPPPPPPEGSLMDTLRSIILYVMQAKCKFCLSPNVL